MRLYRRLLSMALLALVMSASLAMAQQGTESPPGSREQALALAVQQRINSFRAQRGLPPFSPSTALAEAAASHSRDMVVHDFFDHNSPLPGRTRPNDRTAAAGYRSPVIAENLFMAWVRRTTLWPSSV